MGWIGFRTLHGFHHHIQLEAVHTVRPHDCVQWGPGPLPTNLLAVQELPSTAGRQTSRQAWPGGSAAMESCAGELCWQFPSLWLVAAAAARLL